jgi:hypothetical protein
MGVTALEALEQGQGGAQLYFGGVAVTLLNQVLGDAVLDQRAGPVQVAEDDGLFGAFGRRYFDRSLDNLGNFNGPVYDLFDYLSNFNGSVDCRFHNLGNFNGPVYDLFDYLSNFNGSVDCRFHNLGNFNGPVDHRFDYLGNFDLLTRDNSGDFDYLGLRRGAGDQGEHRHQHHRNDG